MSKYRVALRRSSVEIVTAHSPYQAAIVASDNFGDGVEVSNDRPAVGRPATNAAAVRSVKKVAKRRRAMASEERAKLAQSLVKARAARARNINAAKKAVRKSSAKRVPRK
jgi:hypothetical protein